LLQCAVGTKHKPDYAVCCSHPSRPPPLARAAAARAALTLNACRRRIVWLPSGAAPGARGLSLRFPQIVMHAVSTDASSFPRPCVYLQLDEGDDDEDAPMTGLAGALGGGGSGGGGGQGGSGSGEEGGEEGEEGEEITAELRLVPADAAAGEAGRLVAWSPEVCPAGLLKDGSQMEVAGCVNGGKPAQDPCLA
jgi:hypothetical protein